MARKSFTQLSADLLSSFPDNITGAITPLVLRTYIQSFLDAIRPAYGVLARPGPTVQTIGTTDTPVVFDSGLASSVPDYTYVTATGTITRLEAGSTRITINGTVEAANGRLLNFTLYKNGVASAWKAAVTTQGAGKPVDITMVAFTYEGGQAIYQLQVRADAAGTAITVSNLDMIAETVPVNEY